MRNFWQLNKHQSDLVKALAVVQFFVELVLGNSKKGFIGLMLDGTAVQIASLKLISLPSLMILQFQQLFALKYFDEIKYIFFIAFPQGSNSKGLS
jgi:hypothetical protein